MRILLIQALIFITGHTLTSAQTYRAEYTLTYVRDSTDMEKKRTERAFLFIENNDKTYFCTEGYLKSDSLKQLVNQGRLSAYDVIGNTKNFHHTKYYQFFERQIPYNYFTAHERISLSYYKYKILPKFKWSLTDEKKQIIDYQCTKATTFYAGRTYTAWFTDEIPITAGPHVFCGLPGFIVEIYDETGSYNFKLKQFQKYGGYIPPKPAFGDNSIETTHKKIFEVREDLRQNPLDFESRMYDNMPSLRGRIPQDRVEYLLSDNNPLELSID